MKAIHFNQKLAIILFLAIFLSVPLESTASAADATFTVDNSATVLELTIPTTVTLSLTPTSGTAFNTANLKIGIGTNNPAGYSLSMSATSATLNRNPATTTDGNGNTITPTIPTITGTYSTAAFGSSNQTINKWGYKKSTDTNYGAIVASTTIPLKETEGPSNSTGSDVTLDFAAKVDTTLASGTYQTTLNFTAVATVVDPGVTCNPSGTTIATIVCMQDITADNKSAVLASMTQDEQYRLYDSRDDKQYYVAKLADGNIWMTQNLDLCIGCTDTAALTSENTDISTTSSVYDSSGIYATGYSVDNGVYTWEPASTAITSSYTLSGTTVSPAIGNNSEDNNVPYSVEGGDTYIYTSGSTSDDTVHNGLSACMTDGGHTEDGCKHYHAGNYYNWTAAIASNESSNIGATQYANATNSICPKGWKLPYGRDSGNTSTYREFGQLWYSTGITGSLTATSYATDGFINIRVAPLFFVRGGTVRGSSLSYRAYFGYYWSSTVDSTDVAYYAYFESSYIFSAYDFNRYGRTNGNSVRCLAR